MSLAINSPDTLEQVISSRDALAELLTVVGHDLRQPLQVAMLCIDRVLERIAPGEAFERLQIASDALGRLNSELSEIARVSQLGQFVVRVRALELDEIFGKLQQDWENYANACGVTLSFSKPSVMVLSDRVMLQSILRNLVGNAIRCSAFGDHVSVCCQESVGFVTISVVDEGCGISSPRLERIFDAFVRSDRPNRSEGLGLGLTIVRQFAEKLSHQLSVSSVEDVGSTFSITVPRLLPRRTQSAMLTVQTSIP